MPTDVIDQLRNYLDYAGGQTAAETLAASPARSKVPWYRRGPVLALLAGVLVLLVGVPALLLTSDQAPPAVAELPDPLDVGVERVWPDAGYPGGPDDIAAAFADHALGWTDVEVVSDPQASPDGPVWTTIRHDDSPDLEVLSVPIGAGLRVLMQVGSPGLTVGPADDGTGQQIGISRVEGSDSAVLHIRYVDPDRVEVVPVTGADLDQGRIEVDSDSLIGGIVAVYLDADGESVTAVGGHFGPFDESLIPTETTVVAPDVEDWSIVAELPVSVTSGTIFEPIDEGLVVLRGDSTTHVDFDGSTTFGEAPPVTVSAGCCGSAVAIPVGSQLIIFDAYAPGTWLLDPETVTWDQIGDRPTTGDVLGSAVIANHLYVVTASPRAGTTNAHVAALDITTWQWTDIEPVPAVISVGGVTTDGERLIVAGVRQNGNNIIVEDNRQPVAYSFQNGTWEALPDVPIDGQAATVAWVDDVGLLAWNYELDSALLGDSGSWASTGPVPMDFSECYPQSRQVDSGTVALFCGQLAYFNGASLSWSAIPTNREAKHAATSTAIYELAPASDGATLSVLSVPTAED
jgi:hypothetical protein